ncbi:tape measure protein [Spirosoma flavum]|uniref:Tape measure protein n=1 Tax=Spirosoma flavum TaxID=2048557 RepID=A0ABW6AR05_9BACT
MNTTLFEDLVNYKSIAAGIAKLEAANAKFADAAVAQNERIGNSMQSLAADAAGLREQITSFSSRKGSSDSGLSGLKDDVKKLTKAEQDYQAVLSRNKTVVDLNTASIGAMKQRMADLRVEYDKIDRSGADAQARMKAIASETKQTATVLKSLTIVTKQAAQAVVVAEGSYKALDIQTQKLRSDLKGLAGAFNPLTGEINKHNRAAVEMQKRIETNDKALKTMDSTMGVNTRRVGSYKDALKDIGGQLIGITSIAGAVALAFEGIKSAVGIISDMERYDAGLKAVSRDSADFARSQQFLTGLADKLGYEYGDLVDSYKGLKAATKDTALEGRNTEKMFSAVATAGAKLQLSSETVTGTLLALTQMISKGHIQAEELRGQLGERLPGALRLMSEALGVSESKLNTMMEQGQLIATEVMPKFADSLDKAYGLKQGEKIDRLGASVNRLKNEMGYLLKAFNDNTGVTSIFSAIANGLSNSLGDIRRWLKDGSVLELVTFFGSGSLTNRNQQRRDTEQATSAFSGMNPKQRKKQINDLKVEEKSLIEFGEVDKAKITRDLRQKLERENIKIELAEQKDSRRQLINADKDAIEKNEIDLARFQKQSVRKRTAEILALEKQLAADPKNEVLAKKIEVYSKLDADQKSKDKAVNDRLKQDKPNDDSTLETLNKQIEGIEKTLQSQAMQDLKAGRLVTLDPELVARVAKLKEQYESIKLIQEQIENGSYGKPITGADTPLKSITSIGDERTGKNGKTLNDEQVKVADAKRLAELTKNLDNQTGIMRDYDTKRRRLEYDFNNDMKGLPEQRKIDLFTVLYEIEDAERQGDKDEVQRLKDKYAQMSEADKDYLSKKKEIQEKYFEVGTTLINGLFEIEQQKNQNALQQVEKNKEYELSLVGDNAGAKAAIEQKYAAQSKQLQHQQDVAARNQALFNIAISTAQAAVKALPNVGLAVAIGILGAVQAGIVLAKPLPQYAEGKNVADNYEGPAEVGEAGRELLFRNGRASLIDRPSIVNVKRNDVILPNHLTERMLNDEMAWEANSLLHRSMNQRRAVEAMNQNRERYQVRMMSGAMGYGSPSAGAIGKAFGAEIAKHPAFSLSIDKEGFNIHQHDAHHKKLIQKNKHQLGRKN